MKWMNKHKKSLVDGGAPLGKTKRVDAKGASNTKNSVGGYSIVQAASTTQCGRYTVTIDKSTIESARGTLHQCTAARRLPSCYPFLTQPKECFQTTDKLL